MEEKIHWQDQAQSLQEKYVSSIEGLKKDLVSFKAKLADENRSIYSEFQTQIQALNENKKPQKPSEEHAKGKISAEQ